MVCALITDPYAYETTLQRAIDLAKQSNAPLAIIFVIAADELRRLVEDLGEKGWLGPGSVASLEASMLAGYRLLAREVLAEAVRLSEGRHRPVEPLLYEGASKGLLRFLKQKGCSKVVHDGFLGDRYAGMEG